MGQNSFYAGLSGLQLPVPKYLFPPPFQDASRLTYYSTFFNSIEINSSFYRVPMAATVRKWASSVHDNFKFTFKLWKEITHVRGLHFQKSDVEIFLKAIDTAYEKKGCLLVQFPPALGEEYRLQLERLLSSIKETDPLQTWNIAVEFRNKSWYQEHIYKLIDDFQATVVMHDIPKSATPDIDLASEVIYMRFHGPTGNYRGSYSDEILSEHAAYIKDWIEEGKKVYVYFNNTMGEAFKNLETLHQHISS